MLRIKQKRTSSVRRYVVSIATAAFITGGMYLLALVTAPTVAPIVAMKPINVADLPSPEETDDRIIIPRLGINIPFAKGTRALDRGAEWRMPDRGDPVNGGNFIIAAHRFNIQATPLSTVEKSPFYNIDKLTLGDKIVVDFSGVRYGYEIDEINTIKETQTEIESQSTIPKLTVYSYEHGDTDTDARRTVLTAKPLGKVALSS